ncbi:hypothetical protein [Thermococcus sp. JdF3]|uniref:hypothetical protein n=1 Tax=Thermococcus sp. JdF3 TaxID=1638258 RepID=UPI00143BF0A3|nr:hypothetical protein [Thermococcus sp. JdF3]NJE02264.1 hypothetical protein [Thermococcus sp. JdF3]
MYREFKAWEVLGIRVAATTGDYDSTDEWLGRYDIIIATSEKFDSLLRHGSASMPLITGQLPLGSSSPYCPPPSPDKLHETLITSAPVVNYWGGSCVL